MSPHIEFVHPSATEIINNKELEEIINCFGSFLSIITNKQISCVTFFMLIVKHPEIKQVLISLSDAEWIEVCQYLAYRYPLLNKSKKIKSHE